MNLFLDLDATKTRTSPGSDFGREVEGLVVGVFRDRRKGHGIVSLLNGIPLDGRMPVVEIGLLAFAAIAAQKRFFAHLPRPDFVLDQGLEREEVFVLDLGQLLPDPFGQPEHVFDVVARGTRALDHLLGDLLQRRGPQPVLVGRRGHVQQDGERIHGTVFGIELGHRGLVAAEGDLAVAQVVQSGLAQQLEGDSVRMSLFREKNRSMTYSMSRRPFDLPSFAMCNDSTSFFKVRVENTYIFLLHQSGHTTGLKIEREREHEGYIRTFIHSNA